MKKTRGYRQCLLTCGNVSQVTHLPDEIASSYKTVYLKEDGKYWDIKSFGDLVKSDIAEARAHAWGDIWNPSTAITSRGNK